MLRVLQVVDSMDMGGIQSFVMNLYRNIDRNIIQFDFLTFRNNYQVYENEINELGGKLYKLPSRREAIFNHRKNIGEFFENHKEYGIVHYHTSNLSDITVLEEATKYKVPIRIIHSHSTKASGSFIHTVLHYYHKSKLAKIATHFFACGTLAAEWFYSDTPLIKKYEIINNGIDCDSFQFSYSVRDKMRQSLGLNEEFVIGHVGRFHEVKNHCFLVMVFKEFINMYPEVKSKLILVGEGYLMNDIKKISYKLNIYNNILFLGNRNDIPSILQAMDVMVIPSLYEGFPVTAIEAQASGLPCILSDSITKDVIIKSNVRMLSLNKKYSEWAYAIKNCGVRIPDNRLLKSHGFDVSTSKQKLIDLYMQYDNMASEKQEIIRRKS